MSQTIWACKFNIDGTKLDFGIRTSGGNIADAFDTARDKAIKKLAKTFLDPNCKNPACVAKALKKSDSLLDAAQSNGTFSYELHKI